MSSRATIDNQRVYSNPDVVAWYADQEYLTPCERLLFSEHIPPGSAVLDLGVGCGRTTPYLAGIASKYIGVDYSSGMIEKCRQKFPTLHFIVGDASELAMLEDRSFDAIVMAFNGVDNIIPAEKRWRFFRECKRLLRPGGVLIFSSHNARSVLFRPVYSRAKVRAFARQLTGEQSPLFPVALYAITAAKVLHSLLRAARKSAPVMFRRMSRPVFWSGEGHLVDPGHGGLLCHYWVPRRVAEELAGFDFQLVRFLGDDYPQRSNLLWTHWYYYVFRN